MKNRSVASGLAKTPLELWTGKKPDVSNLRVFGSPAMVHVPKVKRTKWQKKSKKMILVGYGDNTKGYRLYDCHTNTVITSRDVVVLEDKQTREDMVVKGDRKPNLNVVED